MRHCHPDLATYLNERHIRRQAGRANSSSNSSVGVGLSLPSIVTVTVSSPDEGVASFSIMNIRTSHNGEGV
jgi:hypothetical protein